MKLGQKKMNARKGIKTSPRREWRLVLLRQKKMNARKGIKTSDSLSATPLASALSQKKMNARKGIKTNNLNLNRTQLDNVRRR